MPWIFAAPSSDIVGVTNVWSFSLSWITEGEEREPSVVHELTKNSSLFDCDYITRENLNLLLNKSSRN